MRDIQTQVLSVVNKYPGCLWTPSLAKLLAEHKQLGLLQQIGMAIGDYGTHRLLVGSSSSSRRVFASVPISPTENDGQSKQVLSIEILPKDDREKYRKRGLTFFSEHELACSKVLECFRDAVEIINLIPQLGETIGFLARICHMLKSDDDGSDISYSDPLVPFSIWVSVPRGRVANDSLRVSESILHESMHLQLTLIEGVLPLIHSREQTFFSPWKKAWRPSLGILHSLYVFRAIDQFFERLLSLSIWSPEDIRHMERRRMQIGQQISQFEGILESSDFTDVGRNLVTRLLTV